MKRFWGLLCGILFSMSSFAQSYDEFRERMLEDFASFRTTVQRDYEDFRQQVNREYAEFVRQAWQAVDALRGIPVPEDTDPVPPVIYEEERDSAEDVPVVLDTVFPVVVPEQEPRPQPQPVVPIEEDHQGISPQEEVFEFDFFNTRMQVRLQDRHRFSLPSVDENAVADMWLRLSGMGYEPAMADCLELRSRYRLCDWAYLLMLQELSRSFLGTGDEAVLLTAYLYCQSGYKMRLARSSDGHLLMLYASQYLIYGKSYWVVGGDKFYMLDEDCDRIYLSDAAFPQEQPLSLRIQTDLLFADEPVKERALYTSDMGVQVEVNENLIGFYDKYPTAMIGDNVCTRWALYANAPMSEQTKSSLYPRLRAAIAGKSQREAANVLLNFVQKAFDYGYDEKIWGQDRAFFAEETLYYPYSDCEDRSILFSRLIRDLLDLDVVLVYYPGHLATGVHFDEDGPGDYLAVGGSRYIICDPTYIGAPVGRSMPNLEDAAVQAILLE